MFKAGQKVRIKSHCSGCEAGKVYELHYGASDGCNLETLFAWNENTNKENSSGCSCQDNWELISEFKVGDNVRIVRESYGDFDNNSSLKVGETFIVEEIFDKKWLRPIKNRPTGVYIELCELVESTTSQEALTADELLKYIIENGITKVRLTNDFPETSLKAGNKIWMGLSNFNFISSYDYKTDNRNIGLRELSGLDYQIDSSWHILYRGKFEIVSENKNEPYLKVGEELKIGGVKINGEDVGSPIESNKQFNQFNQPNKKTIMSKVLDFIKNAPLSSDEKLLRKYNMKDDKGNYTEQMHQAVLELEASEKGYKSFSDMMEKIGSPSVQFTNVLMLADLITKHEKTILENLATLKKEEKEECCK